MECKILKLLLQPIVENAIIHGIAPVSYTHLRDINTMPVFAKAGAVIPMTEEIDAVSTCGNPSSLTLKVYAGADGSFSLYEDDNETCDLSLIHIFISLEIPSALHISGI